ncbi:MAG: 3-deoxy-manno-octulosonate cytidylyltransferase [Flavobacteriales bacterium]|nr:3-deoxy-manno-octulosonate cytidylyltransferase [Flavobacteriales bacterium]|tara:strand:- start:4266 stop:4982 length:717 start_codon:yes stop_codon:yes gene_type:complete
MTVIGIIPSRYYSSRFPGKPLENILGKSMIQRVYEQAIKSKLDKVVVATDDHRIFNEVLSFNGEVVMTSSDHFSGTERCLEAINKINSKHEIIINIQGDEPFINPTQINQLIDSFNNEEIEISTLAKLIESEEIFFDPNKIKVTINNKKAVSFDRIINSEFKKEIFYKHIGIYAYRSKILKKICLLNPSSLEIKYGLEQLRWLQNGIDIVVLETSLDSFNVDTPNDLKKIIERFGSSK